MNHTRFFLMIFGWLLALQLNAQTMATARIRGYAPAYVGEKIELIEVQDYFSLREQAVAITEVAADSTFTFEFYNPSTRKLLIRSKKNTGYLYVQPRADYEVIFPEKNKYDTYNPNGNFVEVSFLGLDSLDINYKILSFDKWVHMFLGEYYYKKGIDGNLFVKHLDTLKANVEKAYEADTQFYFKTYVRFSMASLEDIQFKGNRNRYEKYDFFIQPYPVVYQNDIYMNYIKTFYENLLPRLDMEVNNRVYLGLLKNSPTLIINALSNEYTLRGKNVKLRELVMIKALTDNFYKGDLPQTNILAVLDSISRHGLFLENRVVAQNLIYRLTELVPGSKSPAFVFQNHRGEERTLSNYQGKHVYIQFLDPTIKENVKELELLKEIYKKYEGDVHIITFLPEREYSRKQQDVIQSIPWDRAVLQADSPIWKSFQVATFSHYVLLDGYGYIVSAPALRPIPNGQYETIDKTFFMIRKAKGNTGR